MRIRLVFNFRNDTGCCFPQNREYPKLGNPLSGVAVVICASKNDKTCKIFPALEWLTTMNSQIPENEE